MWLESAHDDCQRNPYNPPSPCLDLQIAANGRLKLPVVTDLVANLQRSGYLNAPRSQCGETDVSRLQNDRRSKISQMSYYTQFGSRRFANILKHYRNICLTAQRNTAAIGSHLLNVRLFSGLKRAPCAVVRSYSLVRQLLTTFRLRLCGTFQTKKKWRDELQRYRTRKLDAPS